MEEGDEIVEAWEKMSKSKHNGVDPEVCPEVQFGCFAYR